MTTRAQREDLVEIVLPPGPVRRQVFHFLQRHPV